MQATRNNHICFLGSSVKGSTLLFHSPLHPTAHCLECFGKLLRTLCSGYIDAGGCGGRAIPSERCVIRVGWWMEECQARWERAVTGCGDRAAVPSSGSAWLLLGKRGNHTVTASWELPGLFVHFVGSLLIRASVTLVENKLPPRED